MQIELTRKFQKQMDSCQDQTISNRVIHVIDEVIAAETINQIHNLKKLTGFRNIYRIRMGSYRLGLVIENGTVTFAALDHRSSIYKYFP